MSVWIGCHSCGKWLWDTQQDACDQIILGRWRCIDAPHVPVIGDRVECPLCGGVIFTRRWNLNLAVKDAVQTVARDPRWLA